MGISVSAYEEHVLGEQQLRQQQRLQPGRLMQGEIVWKSGLAVHDRRGGRVQVVQQQPRRRQHLQQRRPK